MYVLFIFCGFFIWRSIFKILLKRLFNFSSYVLNYYIWYMYVKIFVVFISSVLVLVKLKLVLYMYYLCVLSLINILKVLFYILNLSLF